VLGVLSAQAQLVSRPWCLHATPQSHNGKGDAYRYCKCLRPQRGQPGTAFVLALVLLGAGITATSIVRPGDRGSFQSWTTASSPVRSGRRC
jgi:hypothetical protein